MENKSVFFFLFLYNCLTVYLKFGQISYALHSDVINITVKLLEPSECFVSKLVLMEITEDLKDVN